MRRSWIGAEENRELAKMMPQETWSEERDREEAHRAMDDQPWMVIFMDISTFRVIWVSEDGGARCQRVARTEVAWWQDKARRGGLIMSTESRNASPDDFLLRQQSDLDRLAAALRGY